MFRCSKKEILLFLLFLTVAVAAKSQINSMNFIEEHIPEHDTTFQSQQSGNPFNGLGYLIEMILAPTKTEKEGFINSRERRLLTHIFRSVQWMELEFSNELKVTVVNDFKIEILRQVALSGNMEIADMLPLFGITPNRHMGSAGRRMLIEVFNRCDFEMVDFLLSYSLDALTPYQGDTPLTTFINALREKCDIGGEHLLLLDRLLSRLAPQNHSVNDSLSSSGETPLTLALSMDNHSYFLVKKSLVTFLLSNGADPNLPNAGGIRPLEIATTQSHITWHEQVLNKGLSHRKSKAYRLRETSWESLLLDHGADPNQIASSGRRIGDILSENLTSSHNKEEEYLKSPNFQR